MTQRVPRLLIAERNPNVRSFLSREFSREGYAVRTAKNGFELVKAIHSGEQPDLIVLDLDVPYLEGGATVELLQRHKILIPIVIHSLGGVEPDHPLMLRAKAWVKKTGDPGQLKQVVRGLLEKHRLGAVAPVADKITDPEGDVPK